MNSTNLNKYHCDSCGDWAISFDSHYQRKHRRIVNVLYVVDGSRAAIHRDPKDGLFECFKCQRRYECGKSIEWHGSHGCPGTFVPTGKHRNTVLGYHTMEDWSEGPYQPPLPSRMKTGAEFPEKPHHRRKNPRRGLPPSTTRTKRALIRHLHAEGYAVAEIAEHVGVDARTVHYAVENKSDDNLVDDDLYLDGERGDIINVDSDHSISAGFDMIKDDDDDDIEVVTISGRKDDHVGGTSAAGASQARGVGQRSVQQTTVSGRTRTPYVAVRKAPVSWSSSSSTGTAASSSKSTGSARPSSTSAGSSAVRAFLESLTPSLGALSDAFAEIGVNTCEDLDALCLMPHRWGEVEAMLLAKGVTRLQWWVLADAFKRRATV